MIACNTKSTVVCNTKREQTHVSMIVQKRLVISVFICIYLNIIQTSPLCLWDLMSVNKKTLAAPRFFFISVFNSHKHSGLSLPVYKFPIAFSLKPNCIKTPEAVCATYQVKLSMSVKEVWNNHILLLRSQMLQTCTLKGKGILL